jgi:hypothetical protein
MTLDRGRLGELADALIPAESGMPAATEAGAVGPGLDAVLEARPDLAAPLASAASKSGIDEVRADPAAWAALTAAVTAAYYMNADVRRQVGYAGQQAIPFDPDHGDFLEDGLLDSVKARGPVYRPTP